jgi:undecaprenyl-diphosphatase
MGMDYFWLLIKAFILGIVEGLTEFLPISSTGHLILAADLLGFQGPVAGVFEIVIQSGAIAAVCVEYRSRLWNAVRGVTHDRTQQQFVLNLVIAFLPLAILGLLFKNTIEAHLFKPIPVAIAFIVGGLIILWVERRPHTIRVQEVDQLTTLDAVKLGLFQAFALIPGTSRSGATIIGGLMMGLSRKAAAEFSFFLAVPTLLAASIYKLYKARDLLSINDIGLFAVGILTAFISAYIAIRALIRYVSTHDFTIFAWYRIAFGAIVLITAHMGWIDWTQG